MAKRLRRITRIPAGVSATEALSRTGAHHNPVGELLFNRTFIGVNACLSIAVARMIEEAQDDLRYQSYDRTEQQDSKGKTYDS